MYTETIYNKFQSDIVRLSIWILIFDDQWKCFFFFKKNFMVPFCGWGSTASRLEPLREAVYFLPLSSQKFLVLILSTSEGWKAESTLEPPSGFKHGTSGCLLSRKARWDVRIGSFWPKNEVFYRQEWNKEGATWKWILSIFKFRNECYKQLEQKKKRKKWLHLSSFHVLFLISYVLKLSKKCVFSNFLLTPARNLSLLKSKSKYIYIYIHIYERSRYAFLENGNVYYAMTYCFRDIRF